LTERTEIEIPYRHVCIYWIDAKSSTDWKPLEEAEQLDVAYCVSTGFILKKSDIAISLAQDFSFNEDHTEIEDIGNIIVIPVACIVYELEMTKLIP
tara:strand:- start:662 stop:949 length:288 start_codon:yes stop_codon:yes gene_type:complete